jgi:elongation factor P
MLSLAELKTGRKIELEQTPYLIVWNQFSKTARQGGCMAVKMKNMLTGQVIQKTFQGSDKVEEANIQFQKAQFLYQNGDDYEFMDQVSFETISLRKEVLGDTVNFISEGAEVDIQYFDSNPISIQIQPKMTFEVIETEPGVKGNTAGTANKPAKISTGLVVKVPLFINQGDKIVVNTLNSEYVERAK